MDGLAFDDLDDQGRELDDPLQELEQDVVHILLETFGSNPDDLARGIGLGGAISGNAKRVPHIKSQIESQLHDDERIQNASCEITPTDSRGAYRVDLTLVVAGQTLGLSYLTDGAGGIRRTS